MCEGGCGRGRGSVGRTDGRTVGRSIALNEVPIKYLNKRSRETNTWQVSVNRQQSNFLTDFTSQTLPFLASLVSVAAASLESSQAIDYGGGAGGGA